MSLAPRLRDLQIAARRREWLAIMAMGLPWSIALGSRVWARGEIAIATALALGGFALCASVAWFRSRRYNDQWLLRGLDSARADFQDSSELLLRDKESLSALQRLQQKRMQRLVDGIALPDLRSAWPWRRIAACAIVAALTVLLPRFWPQTAMQDDVTAPSIPPAAHAPASTTLTRLDLDITPPHYTGLPVRHETTPDARVAEGAQLRWRLQFDVTPTAVSLEFHDGQHVALVRNGDAWTGSREMRESALYRVTIDGAAPLGNDELHRIDVIADEPPDVRVTAPDKTLSLLTTGQQRWDLAFEASDDYGIGEANLSVTLAQGSGENIVFKESQLRLRGEGDSRQRRYRHALDLAALGIAQGDDVVVRLAVSDTHPGKPNITRSASFILRWPPDASADSSGMDGLVRTTLPAYFRSQRQIIIDTQALIAKKSALSQTDFVEKSDTIGVDEKILRLRYGQFLGEEFDSEPGEHRPPGSKGEKGSAADPTSATHDDALHEAPQSAAKPFGSAGNVLTEFGHAHDQSEAATLLDPDTRRVLKAALDQMWRAEEQLRLGQPAAALPFEMKALEHIKQVQQATRIYLARVGLELPPVDETRRLSGERKDLADRSSGLQPLDASDHSVADAWNSLADGVSFDASAFDRWVRAHAARMPEALGLIAANDALLRDVRCIDCRARLRALLWPLLVTPPAGPDARVAPDVGGGAYLDALDESVLPAESHR
ncbi:MAG: DUF4175 family protein [Tahibacter sp.]